MASFTREAFGSTVRGDFGRRRSGIVEKSMQASGALTESKALGHPLFEDLAVGQRRVSPMVAVFIDLSDFTGRTFWDDPVETVDLAHAVLSGFIETVTRFGGYPLGLRGDGLFAGFTPGDPEITAALALAACAFALDAVENDVNPWLRSTGREPLRARAGLDYGEITFVRTGIGGASEVNPSGFAANFAAKCEKWANGWEIVTGEGLRTVLPQNTFFVEHSSSPKRFQRNYDRESYRFYDFRWRRLVPDLPEIASDMNAVPAAEFEIH